VPAGAPAQPAACDAVSASISSDQVIAACTAIIANDPNRAMAFFHRANAYRRRGDVKNARADIDQAIRLDPTYAPAFVVHGLVSIDPSRSIADYGQAIALDPTYARAFLYRGKAHTYRKDYVRAIADFDQAIALDVKLADAMQARADAYRDKGEPDRAIADYDAIIRGAPKSADAFDGRAIAYLAKGDVGHAVADAGEAIAIDDSDISAYWLRGRLRVATGDFTGAAADMRHILDGWAEDSRAMLWLAAARTRAKADARAELTAAADKLHNKDWPYPLIGLQLGGQTPDRVMAAAGTPEQRCEAAFHIAQWRLGRNERDSAIAYLTAAARDCDKGSVEAVVTTAELKRLGQ
jgi:tetratricopeptide (TPR) repeat protein